LAGETHGLRTMAIDEHYLDAKGIGVHENVGRQLILLAESMDNPSGAAIRVSFASYEDEGLSHGAKYISGQKTLEHRFLFNDQKEVRFRFNTIYLLGIRGQGDGSTI